MQIGQLRAFLAVAEQRHFTKAAATLGMAQPSVSAHVRRLEAEVRQPLFHRLKGNVALTPAGEALLPFARRIVADVVRDGGLPPLMIEPIDFAQLYRTKMQEGGQLGQPTRQA